MNNDTQTAERYINETHVELIEAVVISQSSPALALCTIIYPTPIPDAMLYLTKYTTTANVNAGPNPQTSTFASRSKRNAPCPGSASVWASLPPPHLLPVLTNAARRNECIVLLRGSCSYSSSSASLAQRQLHYPFSGSRHPHLVHVPQYRLLSRRSRARRSFPWTNIPCTWRPSCQRRCDLGPGLRV